MNTSKNEKRSEIVLFLIMVFIAGVSGYLFYHSPGSTMQVVHFLMFSIFGIIALFHGKRNLRTCSLIRLRSS